MSCKNIDLNLVKQYPCVGLSEKGLAQDNQLDNH